MSLQKSVIFSASPIIQRSELQATNLTYDQMPNPLSDRGAYTAYDYYEKPELSKNSFNIIETERVKIGHELHDSVNPLLAVAKLYMEIIKTVTPRENQAKVQAISSILMAIQNIRQISSELVISQKEDFSLPVMINDLVKRIQATGIFKISLSVRHKKEFNKLCGERKLSLYRIVQEQLNNTIKYSKSGLVKIILFCKKGMVELRIADNGVGFDKLKSTKGIGLNNIEKRVMDLRGSVEIISSPGNGCLLHVAFPVSTVLK